MKDKTKKEIDCLVIALALLLVVIIYLNFGVGVFNIIPNSFIHPILDGMDDEFIAFALLVNYSYELIPQTLQQLSIGAISTVLLVRGFNPWAFGFVIALGKLTGQYMIYFAFRIGFHHNKKNFGALASANHILHKYHYIAFLFAPWASVAGDGLMAVAGHQRINPVKILPILFVTDLVEAYKFVFWTLGQIEGIDLVDGIN